MRALMTLGRLPVQPFSCPGNMVISESSHEVITVVVVWLHPQFDTVVLIHPGFLSCLEEVLWK